MTRREKDLLDALVGDCRTWTIGVDVGLGAVFAAGRGQRGMSGPMKGSGGRKSSAGAAKRGAKPRSTAKAASAPSAAKPPARAKGTGKIVAKSGQSSMARGKAAK